MRNVFFILLVSMIIATFGGCLKKNDQARIPQNSLGENVAGAKIVSPSAPRVRLRTTQGDIVIELFADMRQKTVQNFISLAESGFYNGVTFHRVIKDFMIQTGDPFSKDTDWSNDGTGGPGYTIEDEFRSDDDLTRGSVAMANTGMPNTGGSQFFIVTAPATPWLNGKHTLFGKVVEGMDIVEKIEQTPVNENDHPLEDVAIQTIDVLIDTDKI